MTLITHPLTDDGTKMTTSRSDSDGDWKKKFETLKENFDEHAFDLGMLNCKFKEERKFEEIKGLAEKVLIQTWGLPKPNDLKDLNAEIYLEALLKSCWEIAEQFYDFAKKKEGEMIDDSTKNES